MSHINVTINGRQYRMACEEGQEVRLLKLAENLETRVGELRGKFGEIGDARLTVMAALTVCDELLDANARIRALEGELETLRNVRVAAADRAKATQVAVANALNAAADRIEKTTQMLNRTICSGVAIGWCSALPLAALTLPWRGRVAAQRRGGVTVYRRRRCFSGKASASREPYNST
jgi:cell division protein ZapA